MVVRVGGRKGYCRLGVGGERQPLAGAVALVAANIQNMQPSLPQGPYLESMRRSNASACREHSRYHARHRHIIPEITPGIVTWADCSAGNAASLSTSAVSSYGGKACRIPTCRT